MRKSPAAPWRGTSLPPDFSETHALLGQIASNVFRELRVAATLTDGELWQALHEIPGNVVSFEVARGRENERAAYNASMLGRARSEGRVVSGTHAGFSDLFAPIGGRGARVALVTGPFALARPSAAELLAHWHEITGQHGRASDPEFLHYVRVTLDTATFNAEELECFRRLVGLVTDALGERGKVRRLAAEAEALRRKLSRIGFAEQVWAGVAEMVDERMSRIWSSPHRHSQLVAIGVKRLPEDVAVGLLFGRNSEIDPVDDVLRRDAFQRACVEQFAKSGTVLCGRVGDHGVTLLVDHAGSVSRRKARLLDAGQRLGEIARDFGLRSHLGLGAPDDPAALPERYRVALAAAERALSQGRSLQHAPRSGQRRERGGYRDLRRELVQAVGENPSALLLRFERYIDAVAVRSGYRVEAMRVHLEAGFDELCEAFRTTRTMDERSLVDLEQSSERAQLAMTVREVSEAYRRVASAMQLAMSRPAQAHRDRNLGRAIDFVREHLAEPLRLTQVARIAGYSADRFSKLFVSTEEVTFRHYLSDLRIERAKQLLTSTALSIDRVGELSGFPSRSRLHRAFKQRVRATPDQYRQRARRRVGRQ